MRISFGNNRAREAVVLDFEREDIHFVLLVGKEGAGKAFFHRHVYRDFVTRHLPSTLKFLFIDPNGRDTREWSHSPYLLGPIETDTASAFRALEKLAEQSEERTFAGAGGTQHTIVHIEEDALLRADRQRLERCFERLLAHRQTNQVYIFYSTSVVNRRLIEDWRRRFVDLLVVFQLRDRADEQYLSGHILGHAQTGEHLVVWKGTAVHCHPFLEEG